MQDQGVDRAVGQCWYFSHLIADFYQNSLAQQYDPPTENNLQFQMFWATKFSSLSSSYGISMYLPFVASTVEDMIPRWHKEFVSALHAAARWAKTVPDNPNMVFDLHRSPWGDLIRVHPDQFFLQVTVPLERIAPGVGSGFNSSEFDLNHVPTFDMTVFTDRPRIQIWNFCQIVTDATGCKPVELFFTGSRSHTSLFSGRYFTHNSDYDITMFFPAMPEAGREASPAFWQQQFAAAIHAASQQLFPNEGTFLNTNALYTPWGEEIKMSEDQNYLQIKFAHDNKITGKAFDLTVYRDETAMSVAFDLHKSLETSLDMFRNRMTSSTMSTIVFDLYMRIIKAIRPPRCSSIRAIMMGIASLQFYSREFVGSQCLLQDLERLLNNFFNFMFVFFADEPIAVSDNRPAIYWKNYDVVLTRSGEVYFLPAENEDVPSAQFQVRFLTNLQFSCSFCIVKQTFFKFLYDYSLWMDRRRIISGVRFTRACVEDIAR